jgi:hypothetical protein
MYDCIFHHLYIIYLKNHQTSLNFLIYTIEDLKPHLVQFLKSINEQYNEE